MWIIRLSAALVAAGGFLLASPAYAAPVLHERFHHSLTITFDDFCGIDGVVLELEASGVVRAGTRGRDPLVYFLSSAHGTESWTNPDTGIAFVHNFHTTRIDQQVTDNGDGTLTIVGQSAGHSLWWTSDGEQSLLDTGNIRVSVLVDHNGTPSDPTDDVMLDESVSRLSTGRTDMEGQDFCEDFLAFTG